MNERGQNQPPTFECIVSLFVCCLPTHKIYEGWIHKFTVKNVCSFLRSLFLSFNMPQTAFQQQVERTLHFLSQWVVGINKSHILVCVIFCLHERNCGAFFRGNGFINLPLNIQTSLSAKVRMFYIQQQWLLCRCNHLICRVIPNLKKQSWYWNIKLEFVSGTSSFESVHKVTISVEKKMNI